MATYTKEPTINRLLRDHDIAVTQESLDKAGRTIGKKGAKTVHVPLDQVESVLAEFQPDPAKKLADAAVLEAEAETEMEAFNQNGAPAATTEERKPHPAHVAYRAWEDGVEFPYSDFKELATWPAREKKPRSNQQDTMIKYRNPDGGERVIKESAYEERLSRQGGRGLGYYLLSKDREKEGVELVADFPGAPTLETKCSITGISLFRSEAELYAYLRDVLEAIVTAKVEPENVTWQARHWQAWKLEHEWAEKYRAAKRETESKLAKDRASDEQREKKLRELDSEWRQKGYRKISWFRSKRTSRDLLGWLEEQIDNTLEYKKEVA